MYTKQYERFSRTISGCVLPCVHHRINNIAMPAKTAAVCRCLIYLNCQSTGSWLYMYAACNHVSRLAADEPIPQPKAENMWDPGLLYHQMNDICFLSFSSVPAWYEQGVSDGVAWGIPQLQLSSAEPPEKVPFLLHFMVPSRQVCSPLRSLLI